MTLAAAGHHPSSEPAPGTRSRVAEGIYRATVPIPGALGSVNAWLFEDADGWTVLDCGSDTPAARAAWDSILAGPLRDARVKRLIVSHAHHDHIGLAGLLARRFEVTVNMSAGEWRVALRRAAESSKDAAPVIRHYLSLGCSQEEARSFVEGRAAGARNMPDLPDGYAPLGDGETLRLAGRPWHVMTGGGHSPDHLTLRCQTDRILVAGDQLLPRITPLSA